MDLVDRSFILWERLNLPRRSKARLVVPEPTLCAVHRDDLRREKPAPPEVGIAARTPHDDPREER